jgi:hypothetical protein
MPDGIVQVPPDSTGKQIDCSEVSVIAGQPAQRQRIVLGDPVDAESFATITNGGLNVNVASGVFGVSTPIQPVSGGSGRSIASLAANDGYVQLPPDSTGKRLDTSIVSIGTVSYHRQRIVIGDTNAPGGLAGVMAGALNVNIIAWGGLPFDIQTPVDGDAIVFDGTLNKWVAKQVATPGPPVIPITFEDGEVVSGATGLIFTLAHVPNPVSSLVLVHNVPDFGGIVMLHGPHYSINNAVLTMTASMEAGSLFAWYRWVTL